ncbi:MAG: flagellar hook-length control protein FliK [Ignavibacteriae bacterium]|nr:flagellar hook-length control protein FliK [Ignavibacteriota bacterium]
MADSISILKGMIKPGVIERPALQIDKTVNDYFERSLRERLNDYDSSNISPVSNDYIDNSPNYQAVSHSANNINQYDRNDYNTSYSENGNSYNREESLNNGSGSYIQASDKQLNGNSQNTGNQKDITSKNDAATAQKPEELTANNNQKINSKQADTKTETKIETQNNAKISNETAVKLKTDSMEFAADLKLIKEGKANISNLIINKNTAGISVQKNIKLGEKLKAAVDATTQKLNGVSEKTELPNIKIQPGIIAKSTEIIQEVKQGEVSVKANEQGVLNSKDITGLFIKQNDAVSKNQVINKVDNIAPNIGNIGKEKVAENLKNNSNKSESRLLPTDEKVQVNDTKLPAENNSQNNFNINRTGIAEKVYSTPGISTKEIDLTNKVGLVRVRLEEIADKTLQVAKNLQNNTSYTARLNLKPPSLGTVSIEITMKDDIAKLVMKADTREVAKNLENQLIQLKEKLNQQGIKTESIKIEVRQLENDLTDRHAFFEGSNARLKDGKANREFLGALNQLSVDDDELVALGDEFDDGILINTSIL